MSVDDVWQRDAAHRLRQHLMRGVMARRNYAPDSTYERTKRGEAGPHAVHIAGIFQRWADLWAEDARTCAAAGMGGPGGGFEFNADAAEQWRTNMREADAEVDRYLDANKLPRVG